MHQVFKSGTNSYKCKLIEKKIILKGDGCSLGPQLRIYFKR